MPHRLGGSILGRDIRRRRRPSARSCDVGAQHAARQPQRRAWFCCSLRPSTVHATIRATSRPIRPGLRENGGQYTHAAMWSHAGVCAARGRRSRRRAVFAAQPHQPRQHARGEFIATKSNPTSSAPTCTRRRRTSAAAAGPGTRVRRAGCIEPRPKGCSVSTCGAPFCVSILAYRARGQGMRSPTSTARRATTSRSRTRTGVNRGIVRASLDEREIPGTPCDISLTDDGTYHYVRITLG